MADDLPTPGSDFSNPQLRPRPLNFSRPRPTSFHSGSSKVNHERTGGNVQAISAFHEPNRRLPDEPRFSIDSNATNSTNTTNSAGSEFAWDGQLGELRSKRRPEEYGAQRSTRGQSRSTTSTSGISGSTAAASEQPTVAELPGSAPPPPIPHKLPRILKRTSFEQASSRMSTTSGDWEDAASHHTVSVDGEGGQMDSEGKWKGSDYDYSGLSDAEIRKLRKKGINPALYAEMKAARKGKGKWLNPLSGNAYI